MSSGDGAFEPFVGPEANQDLAPAQAKARDIARALEPSIVMQARHPDPLMRNKAVVLLARMPGEAASAAVMQAISDPNETVQRVALSAVGAHPDPRSLSAVAKVMRAHENWALRVLAVQAMGRLGASGSAAEATANLRESASTRESYALVREAALIAVASYDKKAAGALAQQMAVSDPEPRVRETAVRIGQGK